VNRLADAPDPFQESLEQFSALVVPSDLVAQAAFNSSPNTRASLRARIISCLSFSWFMVSLHCRFHPIKSASTAKDANDVPTEN